MYLLKMIPVCYSTDIMKWEAGIPGKEGTDWEGGVYKILIDFPEEYPSNPPVFRFTPPLFHPNIFTSGKECHQKT